MKSEGSMTIKTDGNTRTNLNQKQFDWYGTRHGLSLKWPWISALQPSALPILTEMIGQDGRWRGIPPGRD